ncbi:alcohol dehydrogenase (plasmid) [Fulvitalea axinellae]|uniref:Alcohol dehydrogenase n=1 Tax=Fulvitalea axinellae TaxID=1182444 RepID=A0AAU9CIL1_9BACT|nr:alcohol dehydrogenase [Fulvitalea axinellae]
MEQISVVERGAIRFLGEYLDRYSPKNIFLVTGQKSFEVSGAKAKLDAILSKYNVRRFSDFETNPKIEDIEKGLAILGLGEYDLVVAIGGGSVIDVAKMISFFAGSEGDIVGGEYKEGTRLPLVAIPTTAGTGSEATHFAVVYKNGVKYSVANEKMLPEVAIVDSELSYNAPEYLGACAGFDALSQAMEAFWNVNSTEESDQYSEESMRLLRDNLVLAVRNNSNDSKDLVSKASFLAGKAINITKTTAAHAMSYPFSIHYGYPHGHAVALILPELVPYNYEVAETSLNDPRGVGYVKAKIDRMVNILGCESVAGLKDWLENVKRYLGLTLKEGEVDQNLLLRGVNAQRAKNNPRKVDFRELLRVCLERGG